MLITSSPRRCRFLFYVFTTWGWVERGWDTTWVGPGRWRALAGPHRRVAAWWVCPSTSRGATCLSHWHDAHSNGHWNDAHWYAHSLLLLLLQNARFLLPWKLHSQHYHSSLCTSWRRVARAGYGGWNAEVWNGEKTTERTCCLKREKSGLSSFICQCAPHLLPAMPPIYLRLYAIVQKKCVSAT